MASLDGLSKYQVIEHAAVHYICISSSISMSELPNLAKSIPRLFDCLGSNEAPTAARGPPFFRYVALPAEMTSGECFDMEVALPISKGFEMSRGALGPGSREAGAAIELKVLPPGQYLETVHVGPPSGLEDATKGMLQHAEREGLVFDCYVANIDANAKGKEVWAARLEWYESDPAAVDVREWRTRISFKLR